jgi:hypothetical protein
VTAPWTPERAAEMRGHLERYAVAEGRLRAELAVALVRSLPEALDEIERLRAEAAHHAEAMRNGGVSLAWAEEQKRITAGLEDQVQQAHEVCQKQAARIAELEGLLSHTACTIDIWNSVDADGDTMEQVLVDTSGMLKAALGGDPTKDARDQPEILRHLPERAQ